MKTDTSKRKVILAGGSGFLGRALAKDLVRRGIEPVVLTRTPNAYDGPGRVVEWDGKTFGPWKTELDGAEALVNLTGKNVNCRPSRKNRKAILASRVSSVRVLGEALRILDNPPPVWVQAGSLAIYGDARDRVCDESAHVPTGFPADVCVAWEEALGAAIFPNIRWVTLRIGFVLGREGGALPFLSRLVRFGLGGSIGGGRQWISWIHRDDMVRIFRKAIENPNWEGVFNATGPEPVTNAEFMASLRQTLSRPWSPPAPAPVVRLGAWLLDSDPAIALTGRRCLPAKLREAGFAFRFPRLGDALSHLFPAKEDAAHPQTLTTHELHH